jgi:hypothetical protein
MSSVKRHFLSFAPVVTPLHGVSAATTPASEARRPGARAAFYPQITQTTFYADGAALPLKTKTSAIKCQLLAPAPILRPRHQLLISSNDYFNCQFQTPDTTPPPGCRILSINNA